MNNNFSWGEVKFSHKRKGYDPTQVDELVNSLYKQNEGLKERNQKLSQALELCNEKIEALSNSTQKLEETRIREGQRIADVMISAVKTAEETVQHARAQAEEIILAAENEARLCLQTAKDKAAETHKQTEAEVNAAKEKLNRISLMLQSAHQRSEQCFEDLDKVFQSALLRLPQE